MSDGTGGSVTWSSTLTGANRPQNTRPLAIFPSKESKELLQEFVPIVDAEVKKLKAEGVKVEVRETEVMAECDKCTMSMVDGKMVTNLLSCEGAFAQCASRAKSSAKRLRPFRQAS